MRNRGGNLYILTGLIIGVVLGVLYAWVLAPIEYIDTTPASLRDDLKQVYISQVAAAFAATENTARAQARLSLLEDPTISDTLIAIAQRGLAEGRPIDEVQVIGRLAEVMQNLPAVSPTPEDDTLTPKPSLTPTASQTFTPSPTTSPAPTRTPSPTSTPGVITETAAENASAATPSPSPTEVLPTRTPTSTPSVPFVLAERLLLCEEQYDPPMLIVRTRNAANEGIPGVEIIVNWAEGEDHFFTGLKPELGIGYADFEMTPELNYTLRLADGSQRISDLTPPDCTTQDGIRIWGTWELVFEKP